MRKVIIIMLTAVFGVASMMAQDKVKNELSVSYGYMGHTYLTEDFVGLSTSVISQQIMAKDVDQDSKLNKSWGGVSVQYLRNLDDRFAVGGLVGFGGTKGETSLYVHGNAWTELLNTRLTYGPYKVKQWEFYIMPTARAYWYRHGVVSLYSRVGIGLDMLINRGIVMPKEKKDNTVTQTQKSAKEEDLDRKSVEARLAFQVMPVGIEVGNSRIRGFMEGGYGTQGVACAGVRVGF